MRVDAERTVTAGGISVRLYPEPCAGQEDGSMIVLTSIGDYDTLVPGDVDTTAEVKFLSNCTYPGIELLLVGHHGSKKIHRRRMAGCHCPRCCDHLRRLQQLRPSDERNARALAGAQHTDLPHRPDGRHHGASLVRKRYGNRKREKRNTEVLDYNAQVRSLREQGPGRLYLLWGREDYLREQYLIELKKLCLPGGEDDFSYHRFDGAELDFQALADAVDAVPFLTERTLIEVRGFDTNKCREEDAQALVQVIGDLPDYCTLVFVMGTDFEPDGRLKTTKAFKKYGELIQFTAQGEPALVKWVGKRFAAHKKRISSEDARQLIFFTGGLMNTMIPEIDKIAAYVQGDTVTRADILAVAHRMPEAVAYELTDRLADQDYDGAMRILADLLADKANTPIFLLAVIGQQMRRLYAARARAPCGSRHGRPARTARPAV